MHTPQQWAEHIKEQAHNLGFTGCGIAAISPMDAPASHFGAWIEAGFHAGMNWITRNTERRCNPAEILPGARSIVVVSAAYTTGSTGKISKLGYGRIARYARSQDYHSLLKPRLRDLADLISALEPDTQCILGIDSGPFLEKAWAVRAGIGWQGKNSLIIRSQGGSWHLLGLIATTLPLAPDSPAVDQCGRCTRCMDMCPTGALVKPGVVDARRCIAYLTVEDPASTPETIRHAMGDWLFGCDACQEACPYNKEAPLKVFPGLGGGDEQGFISIPEALAMDDATFQERYGASPLARAGLTGIKQHAERIRRQTLECEPSGGKRSPV